MALKPRKWHSKLEKMAPQVEKMALKIGENGPQTEKMALKNLMN